MGLYYCQYCKALLLNSVTMQSGDHLPDCKTITEEWLPGSPLIHEETKDSWEARALKAEAKLESLELVRLCARDIVNQWPKVTFRTIVFVTKMVETLSQAIELSHK